MNESLEARQEQVTLEIIDLFGTDVTMRVKAALLCVRLAAVSQMLGYAAARRR